MEEVATGPTPAAQWTPEQHLIELPRPNGAGERPRVLIRAVPLSVLQRTFDLLSGQPTAADRTAVRDAVATVTREQADEWVKAALEQTRLLVEAGVVEPRFAFAPGDEGVPWDSLHPDNGRAIIAGITDLSGVRLPAEAQAALTFRYIGGYRATVG